MIEYIKDVLCIIGIGGLIYMTQHLKWNDRREGRRWWEDTPGSKR